MLAGDICMYLTHLALLNKVLNASFLASDSKLQATKIVIVLQCLYAELN